MVGVVVLFLFAFLLLLLMLLFACLHATIVVGWFWGGVVGIFFICSLLLFDYYIIYLF